MKKEKLTRTALAKESKSAQTTRTFLFSISEISIRYPSNGIRLGGGKTIVGPKGEGKGSRLKGEMRVTEWN